MASIVPFRQKTTDRPVLLLEMVENSINLCKLISGWYFRQKAVRTGHLTLGEGPFRLLLTAPSPPSSRPDTATPSGLRGSQAVIGGKGHKSTSRVVHRRVVLPAARAFVRCRYRCARRLPPRSRGCASLTRSAAFGRDIRDSTRATTPDGPVGVGTAVLWPRYGE